MRKKRKKRKKACSTILTAAFILAAASFSTVHAAEVQTDGMTALEAEIMEIQMEEYQMVKAAQAALDLSSPVKITIPDANLRAAIIAAYNDGASASVTEDTLTGLMLSQYTGSLDLSAAANMAQVTDLTGLNMAKNAALINISSCTQITEISLTFPDAQFTEFVMPDSVKKIGDNAFENCKNLSSIMFPEGLASIGEFAFASCEKLESVKTKSGDTVQEDALPSSLKAIGQQAFATCISLKKVRIPSYANGDILSTSMFTLCKGLEEIEIGAGITVIPSTCFMGAGQEGEGVKMTIAADSSLTKIQTDAFRNMKFVSDSTLDLSGCSKLEDITEGAFRDTEGMVKVILPSLSADKAVNLGKDAFARSALVTMGMDGTEEGIILPDYIASVGPGCFFGDTGVTKVSLPARLTQLPDYLFDGCTSLATVTVAEGSKVTEIGDCAFRNTAIADTDFLLKMNGLTTIGYQKLTSEHINSKKRMDYGVSYAYSPFGSETKIGNNEDKIASLPLGGDKNLDEMNTSKTWEVVAGEDGIKKYNSKYCGSEVFTGCPNLTSVSLPASVTDIGARAFYYRGGVP